ncbi:unnamed protein product [Sphagnum balticum]
MKRKKIEDPSSAEDLRVVQYGAPKNPQDIMNMDQAGQIEDTLKSPKKIDADEAMDPADEDSQNVMALKKKMMRLKMVFDKLK